ENGDQNKNSVLACLLPPLALPPALSVLFPLPLPFPPLQPVTTTAVTVANASKVDHFFFITIPPRFTRIVFVSIAYDLILNRIEMQKTVISFDELDIFLGGLAQCSPF